VAERNAPHLRTPLFAWQSRYDLDQQKNYMGCPNPHRWPAPFAACVNAWGANLSAAIERELLGSNASESSHGAFVDSCSRHCAIGVVDALKVEAAGATPLEALAVWHASNGSADARWWSQPDVYPCSAAACCGGGSQVPIPVEEGVLR
tara:strand:- start:988 stop:1431 length:444 start_codon:yes stop_codon:yes gene_type:complete